MCVMSGCGVVWMWCGGMTESKPQASANANPQATFAHTVRTVQHTTRVQPRHLGVGEQQITRAPKTETESESKTAANTTERGSNRIANGSRPDSKKHIDRHRNITSPNTLEGRLGEQHITRAPETETEGESETAANTTERESNRIADGSRPDSRKHISRHGNITSPNTHTHTQCRRRRPGGPGGRRDLGASCTGRIERARPR